MEYLSEKEVKAIVEFCKNTIMYNAVEKVMLEGIYLDGTLQKDTPAKPAKNWALSLASKNLQTPLTNEELGEELRAMTEGIWFVESGLAKLQKIKSIPEKTEVEETNPAL